MSTTNLGKIGFSPKGEYVNTTPYTKLDVVSYEGSSYIAKGDTTDNLPTNTTYWMPHGTKGSKGDAGGTWANATAIPLTDVGGFFTIKNVEDALQEIINKLNEIAKNSMSTITDKTTGKSYKLVVDSGVLYLEEI